MERAIKVEVSEGIVEICRAAASRDSTAVGESGQGVMGMAGKGTAFCCVSDVVVCMRVMVLGVRVQVNPGHGKVRPRPRGEG